MGGPWSVTEDLLNRANLNWAYSELFQNYSKDQIHEYMNYSNFVSESQGLMIHYAETHDNNRLADKSPVWAKMRTSLSALLSHNGAFGFTNGVEWYAEEKIFVHRSSGLNWGAEKNQCGHISTLTSLLKNHPAFRDGSRIEFINSDHNDSIAALRFDELGEKPLLIVINLNCEKSISVKLNAESLPEQLRGCKLTDLTKDAKLALSTTSKNVNIQLQAGEAVCLGEELTAVNDNYTVDKNLQFSLMNLLALQGLEHIDVDYDTETDKLKENPYSYFAEREILTTSWVFPRDTKRHVLYSPYSVLVVSCPSRFTLRVFGEQFNSFEADDGQHYVIVNGPNDNDSTKYETMTFMLYGKAISRFKSKILFLTDTDKPFEGEIPDTETPLTCLDTNDRGGMMHLPMKWPNFDSKYDCLLGANLSKEFPENRHIMWRRMRIYCRNNSVTYELSDLTLESTATNNGKAQFIFRNPAGSGRFVRFQVTVGMINNENATAINIERLPAICPQCLPDNDPVELILRPDVEDRNFHMETKAHGIEQFWQDNVKELEHGFEFAPDHNRKFIISSDCNYISEPEWSYNHHQKIEAERGQECNTDLFSPGYLLTTLRGAQTCKVLGQVKTEQDKLVPLSKAKVKLEAKSDLMAPILIDALKHFIVKETILKQ